MSDEALLIEEVAAAYRPRDPRQLGTLPAWHDLTPAGREQAFELSVDLQDPVVRREQSGARAGAVHLHRGTPRRVW